MTDTPSQPAPSTPAPPAANVDVNGPDFAAMLAARLCHDFISPASAIVSGLDLLEDPSAQDMREDAMSLIASSARKLADLLQFCRVAFGASASAEAALPRRDRLPAHGIFCEACTIQPPPLSVPTPLGPIMETNIGSSSETTCG